MPTVALTLLILSVGPYLLLMGAASIQYARARRRTPPPPPNDWPTVSVVLPGSSDSLRDTVQRVAEGPYPTDRIEVIQVVSGGADAASEFTMSGLPVRTVECSKDPHQERSLSTLRMGSAEARGDVVLLTHPDCEGSSGWIQSMVQRCTAESPVVVGPTVLAHNDYFLPRLQALQRLGQMALAIGFSGRGIPFYGRWNVAVRPDPFSFPQKEPEAPSPHPFQQVDAVYSTDADAKVTFPSSASSFWAYLRTQTASLRSAFRALSPWIRGVAFGVWAVHLVLLLFCVVAVAVPAWRQPTLLALLGKMGADALLSVPASGHFGQRNLPRSLVPSELMLVFTVPMAGLLALLDVHPPAPS